MTPMTTVTDIARVLEQWFPLALAAEWDNVGLLVGDSSQPVERVMTCLTVTPASADEAIRAPGKCSWRATLHRVFHRPVSFRVSDS